MISVISWGFKKKMKSFHKEGDAILIDKGEKNFWIANCKVAMSCSPCGILNSINL
jgi:hypothetical protein